MNKIFIAFFLTLSFSLFANEDEVDFEMEEVIVETSKVAEHVKTSPVRVQVIDEEHIEKKGATDILDVLESTVGIRVDNQCSICNTIGVSLSGTPSRYTLLLIDGFPIYSSLGQVYGWSNINASSIERIEILKGSQSVLYGTDPIGGVINVITKKPHGDPHSIINFEMGVFDYRMLSASSSYQKDKMGISIVGTSSKHSSVDRDGDDISEYTGYLRNTLAMNVIYDFTPKLKLFTSLSAAQEKRQGGGVGSFIEVINDNDSRRAFSESILSDRFEAKAKVEYKINEKHKATLLANYTKHIQDSDYEGVVYVADQDIIFTELNFTSRWSKYFTTIKGVSFRSEQLDENLATNNYHYYIAGVFLQTKIKVGDLKVDPGVRYDYHNEFGSVFTPAISIRYDLNPNLAFRIGGGSAFRAPTTFYEYAHGVRPEGYQIFNNTDSAEKSYNVNGDIDFRWSDFLNYNLAVGYNKIKHATTIDLTEDGDISIHNVDEDLDIFSIENNLSLNFKYVDAKLGHGYYKYKDDAGVLVSATFSQQFTYDFNFKFKGVNLNINGEIVAPMDLEAVYGEGYNNKDGKSLDSWLDPDNADLNSTKMKESPWYHTVNAKVIIPVKDKFKLSFGVKNIFDYHQNDEESSLFFPKGEHGPEAADVVYIWGPLRGRFIYGGLTASF